MLFSSAAQTSIMASPASLGDLPRALDVPSVMGNGRWREVEMSLRFFVHCAKYPQLEALCQSTCQDGHYVVQMTPTLATSATRLQYSHHIASALSPAMRYDQ